MGSIEKRISASGAISYRVKIRMKGQPAENATFNRLTDARKYEQDTESAIREGRYFKTAQSKKRTVSEMIQRYRTEVLAHKQGTTNQIHYLDWWESHLGCYFLADISPDLVIRARTALVGHATQYSRRVGTATANRYVTALGHVFTVAINEWGWVDDNPVRKIKKFTEPRGRVRYLDKATELPKLIDACQKSKNKLLYPIVVLALSTGGRKNEIITLTWQDVDFDRGQITFQETKNGERRTVPLKGRAKTLIADLYADRELLDDGDRSQFIFPSVKKTKPIEIKTAWENTLKRAGISNFRFHDLRHSTASYLAMNGASIPEIAGVLGHKTLQMVKRYAHLSEAHTHAVIDSMNDKFLTDV